MSDLVDNWESAETSDDSCISDDNLSYIQSYESSSNCDFLEGYSVLDISKNIISIADKLGAKKTRKCLIPFLTNCIIAGKLTELKELASILGDFECKVGGPRYAYILLPPLKELAGSKSCDVRMTAVNSLLTLADIMEVHEVETHFIPLIANMTFNEQCAKRWSVCHLFSTVYLRVNPIYHDNLVEYYTCLCLDTLPSVRQDAAKCLAKLSEVVQFPVIDTKIIPRLKQFSIDQNEHVRTLALSTTISISQHLDTVFIERYIYPIILNSIKDRSWSVRLTLVKNISKMLEAFGVKCKQLRELIFQMFMKLTNDCQSEVRFRSIAIIYDCTVVLYKELSMEEADQIIINYLIPTLRSLSQDCVLRCRMEVPVVLAKFGKIISPELVKDYLIELIKELLEDKNIDFVFNVVKYMKDILGMNYYDKLTIPEDRLICSLKAFIINDSWEMRNTGAMYLGTLAVQMGKSFFEEYLKQAFFILLVDAKSVVQNTTMEVLKMLIREFGMNWALSSIIPFIIDLSYSKNTYNKMAFLSFVKAFYDICEWSTLEKLFPCVIHLHSDENPNLRFTVIKVLHMMMPLLVEYDHSNFFRINVCM
ncbi:serine/threonine-protein phosphatase 2A 65 kDa regulatory subunit A alpha isoform-like isoform X2 [Daktulosphaira vitifoliae]|uniref:serine/threonine-protein phosphatase 2A 65 kDa regulatory subunit A alpha isoform-like isoform X2 n=1 Tax=Daktulosphaira vitifoliae TaxID=58002 RepID=UPI0021AA0482|nr:serine/threonine-protein phosphatase 2A 65 kDa regulatory subunit A alpha isoform-like isoform X2 [Daktulosphaira vitifoliae]